MRARIKISTNRRWKSRNAISSGADVIRVATLMIDQSIPWSDEAKICRPTVSGRVFTEFVTISGHKKLCQPAAA
jgi:hypothetical protein